MEKNTRSALTPWGKLLLLLGPDPEEVAAKPIEEVEEQLRAAGIDPEPVVAAVENLVREAMARWEQGTTKGDVASQEVVDSSEETERSKAPIRVGDDFSALRSTTTVTAETPSYAFDERHIRWYKLGEFGEHFAPFEEYFLLTMLDVEESQKLVDFMLKFPPNQRIFLHRHLALTNTLVVQGEHRLYEPNGALKEVRPVGSYTSSPPGEPHREGAGDEGSVVFFSVRGKEGTLFEFLDDELHVVGTISMQDCLNAFKAQKNA
jgi:quercetin dioxygenase-like cupin family protein